MRTFAWRHGLAVLTLLGCGDSGERDAVPEGAAAVAVAPTRDPCSLLTRPEAEAVLGRLAADPFRTRADTSIADPTGPTCAYRTDGDRYFLVTPEWSYGKSVLDAERMVGGLVRLVADLPGLAADTLEGTWDEAVVGLAGELVLRKGPRAVTISYAGSSTDAVGAIRLSEPVLRRLAEAPDDPRPVVSADGCPLPVEQVAEIIEIPVRLAPGGTRSMDACSYQLVEDPTVEVELVIHPVEIADMVFEGLATHATGLLGASFRPDSLALGEVGWAYHSSSGSEAAVRAGSAVYHARVATLLSTSGPRREDAMVRLVETMMAAKGVARGRTP